MNTQYIKKPLVWFGYRLLFSILGGPMLAIMLRDGWVVLLSFILLALNIPVYYISSHSVARYDLQSYHHSKSYPAKGLVLSLILMAIFGIFCIIMGLVQTNGLGFASGVLIGFRFIFYPYIAILGIQPVVYIGYALPVIMDVAVITLGYIAGLNEFSIMQTFRSKVVYEKKEK